MKIGRTDNRKTKSEVPAVLKALEIHAYIKNAACTCRTVIIPRHLLCMDMCARCKYTFGRYQRYIPAVMHAMPMM